ncbi:MAG: 30S ribosomal protein S8 [Chloroflexi bacterium]|jgi:small subunit ribosomal protein S8|nr:30S ribosomal protein S8 [Chloroflexota bacterium]
MSINDPISDMLTRIRNGVSNNQAVVAMPASKMKAEIARILKEEGFISAYEVVDGPKVPQKILRINLKYVGERRQRRAVITGLVRISKPGRRIYSQKKEIPWVRSGMGIAIVSTPKGVMTGQEARKNNVGGEVLCKVW